jgi:hypothetical protein
MTSKIVSEIANTVGELRELLKDYPDDLPVAAVYDGRGRVGVLESQEDDNLVLVMVYEISETGLARAGLPLTNPCLGAEWPPAEPSHSRDPRWVWAELTQRQAYAGWPCATCGTRRDEHADQATPSSCPELDITDHGFVFAADDSGKG